MEKKMTLLIMAAGMGSRFGGLKQLEPVGENGEYIIDYGIKDALFYGFNRVVIIMKEENLKFFKDTLSKRFKGIIEIEYVFQKQEDLPPSFKCPEDRIKPWGTAHAILSARDVINEPFAVINADDYYGKESYKILADFLKNIKDNDSPEFTIIGYPIKNTLSDNGSVKRGIIYEDKNNMLTGLVESSVEYKNNLLIASPISGKDSFVTSEDTLVSMNMFGFTPVLFKHLSIGFETFLSHADLSKDEYLIPDVLSDNLKKIWNIKIFKTNAKWFGITHRDDLPKFKSLLKKERN